MKKFKFKRFKSVLMVSAAVAVLVLIICLGELDNQRFRGSSATEDSGSSLVDPGTLSPDGQIPTINTNSPPSTSYDPIEYGQNITVTINPAIEDAIIDRDPAITPAHPEYIESYVGGGSFSASEGKVFKNDRVWNVEIQNNTTGEWMTFSFGASIGEYNRFLYLNPTRITTEPGVHGYFHFKASNGTLLNLAQSFDNTKEMLSSHDNFTVRRAMDQLSVAEYVNPMYPGAAWYTSAALNDPVYIDIICYYGQGSIAAILRLWIDKDENGCYYLASLENHDLYLQTDAIFTTAELYHLYERVDADINDYELTGMHTLDRDWNCEDYFFDYREAGSGCYYDYFLMVNTATATASKDYRGYDIMAVTLRNNGATQSITLYYRIIALPYGETHGVYQYLGRDYPFNSTIEELQGSGYPGFD